MSKNVVVCCDGTSNQFSPFNTNVIKLYQMLEHDQGRQVTYYHPGLGTLEAVGALTSVTRKATKLLGLAIGYGLEADVVRAYQFVMSTFVPGDRIFIFGFSRGAYTARAVASLLHMFGLLRRGNDDLVKYAIRIQSSLSSRAFDPARGRETFKLADGFRDTFAGEPCEIHFVGVWDTVSSVGWASNPLRLPFTADNPSISIGRHAVSVDERRAFFRTNLWRPSPEGGPRDLMQVWFAGDHCDVGGGRSEDESGLSDITLAWMAREAFAAGLIPKLGRETMANPEPPGGQISSLPLHESLTGWWRLAEFVPKRHYDWVTRRTGWRMNLFRPRSVPEGAMIHSTTFSRGADYLERLPKSVVAVG